MPARKKIWIDENVAAQLVDYIGEAVEEGRDEYSIIREIETTHELSLMEKLYAAYVLGYAAAIRDAPALRRLAAEVAESCGETGPKTGRKKRRVAIQAPSLYT